MMNWSLIILGLVAVANVALAENSYLVIAPKLLKVGFDNQLSVFIAATSQPVEVKFDVVIGAEHVDGKVTCKPGETRNVTLTLPKEFPIGPGELTIIGTGGVRFEEKRDVIVYDDRHVLLVQTSSSTYQPGDTIEFRVVATDEYLIPVEGEELLIEVYDATLKLVGEFPRVPIRSGLTEMIRFPTAEHCNIGTWLVSATLGNTTSSVQVLVSRPITPSYDLKALFQRFLLRSEKTLRGVVEISCDFDRPIFGRGIIRVGQITEQDLTTPMMKPEELVSQDEIRKWKSQPLEIAGRWELNYDLLSVFNIDLTKVMAIHVYIEVTDLASGHERIIHQIIPIFNRDVLYDIRPLHFEAGIKNEFEIIAKRPDGKPTKVEDMIINVTMIFGGKDQRETQEKSVDIKDLYTRGRNDIGLFNIDIPENCIGLLVSLTPLGEDGKHRGYRTQTVPLMPMPPRGTTGAKLSIELAPTTTTTEGSVVSSQIVTVDKMANFYVQVLPSKPVEKLEPLPLSWILLNNGKILRTGEFTIEPTKECQSKTPRTIRPEEQTPLTCVYNGTLAIRVDREMVPYSTLLVYTFQPSFGYNVAESYRFSVAGLFQSNLVLNATVVPHTMGGIHNDQYNVCEELDSSEEKECKVHPISDKALGKSRIELSFTGTPESIVGLNVFEYDAVGQGLSSEITKERLLAYLTSYEQVPISGMPTSSMSDETTMEPRNIEDKHTVPGPLTDEDDDHNRLVHGMKQREMKPEYRDPKKYDTPMRKPTPMETHHMSEDDINTDPKKPRELEEEEDQVRDERFFRNEEEEQVQYRRERQGFKVRYPIEKMIFGVSSTRPLMPIEGDDVYTTSTMHRFYGEERGRSTPLSYRRKGMRTLTQYDVTVGNNDYVVAYSIPRILTATPPMSPLSKTGDKFENEEHGTVDNNEEEYTEQQRGSQPFMRDGRPLKGTPAWYSKMNSKLSTISQEAFIFIHSGLSIVSDFENLRIPTNLQRMNLSLTMSKLRTQTPYGDRDSFDVRDNARQILEQYITETDSSMIPPPIVLEEQSRAGYYRSLFFNTSRIGSQGTGKVVLPRIKPYSTWLATGFSLNTKSGLAVAQPVRLPNSEGVFVMVNLPHHVQIGEHVLLTYGVNNYLGKDVNNVIVRIRASTDFDLIEQNQPERVVSSNGKDYTVTIPVLKSYGSEIRNIVLVPKRAGVVKLLVEVESELGGDYEWLTTYVRESGILRKEVSGRLFDLTSEKKSYGPIVEKITQSPFLRAVKVWVSGTGLDRLVERHTLETTSLLGIDRALVSLYRALGLRCYLNKTSQVDTELYNKTFHNITTAYQKLQLFGDYDGSYTFVSDEGSEQSSLYLTTLAFGAMISPIMPFHDNVTLNRTLTWILARQRPDGSFDDEGPCYHYRFCTGEFRREAMTALVLLSLTHNNVSEHAPEFIRRQLYGEQGPVVRAVHFLQSRIEPLKSDLLTLTLVELAFVNCKHLPEQWQQRVREAVLARQLTVVPEDGSKYLKMEDGKASLEDQVLLNALTLSIYGRYGDYKTVWAIARYIVKQFEVHPYYDTVLEALFGTHAWLQTDYLIRRQMGSEKFAVTVDLTTDNGQKQQFKIDEENMDITQKFLFKLPVQQITYTVSGYGIAGVCIKEIFVEKQPQLPTEPIPFSSLTQEFMPMPWLNEIKAKTCVTYSPTQRHLVNKENFNTTVVVEVQIPSGMRINIRQIGFFLSKVDEVMYFMYHKHTNKLVFFLNLPKTTYGKPICLEWCLERLSHVINWAPIEVRVYDYLRPEDSIYRLVPVQLQPALLGYSYVDAILKVRPSLSSLPSMQSGGKMPPMMSRTPSIPN